MLQRTLIFLLLNFLALWIGGLFTSSGVSSDWYLAVNKAPWTPPDWVFGAAWTSIMIAFAFYMAWLWPLYSNTKVLIVLFALQWILNVAWNPLFFYMHMVAMALLFIASLTVLLSYMLVNFYPILEVRSLALVPYVVWLFIATSLNAYILFKN